jgi:two-component sensor histidine kinase
MQETLKFRFSFPDPTGARMLGGIPLEFGEPEPAESALRVEMAAADTLFETIDHRIANDLELVSNLLSMQMNELHDEVARQVLRETQLRLEAMAIAYRCMYREELIERLEFRECIETVASNLFRTHRVEPCSILLSIDWDEVWLDFEQGIVCVLILNELLSQKIRFHSVDPRKRESRKRKIRISLTGLFGNRAILRIVDEAGEKQKSPHEENLLIGLLAGRLDGSVQEGAETGFTLTFQTAER